MGEKAPLRSIADLPGARARPLFGNLNVCHAAGSLAGAAGTQNMIGQFKLI
jgi:hypothetical protein